MLQSSSSSATAWPSLNCGWPSSPRVARTCEGPGPSVCRSWIGAAATEEPPWAHADNAKEASRILPQFAYDMAHLNYFEQKFDGFREPFCIVESDRVRKPGQVFASSDSRQLSAPETRLPAHPQVAHSLRSRGKSLSRSERVIRVASLTGHAVDAGRLALESPHARAPIEHSVPRDRAIGAQGASALCAHHLEREPQVVAVHLSGE